MSVNPTRSDGGITPQSLTVEIVVDPITNTVSVETNIYDPAVMCRVIGQAMHIWADKQMQDRVAAAKQRPRLLLPSRRDA